ncbi:MAG: hypothetical protein ACRELB_01945 [Polyangiaceae bacterium]
MKAWVTGRRDGCVAVAAATVVALAAPAVRAQGPEPQPSPTVEACFSAAEKAQPLMKQRKLSAARRYLQVCAHDDCPRAARSDCKAWLEDVTTAQPTVVFVAREERPDGASIAVEDVRVSADGAVLVPARLGAAAVPIDPGMHTLTFEHAGFDPVEQRIDVREGERDRQVDVVFRPPGHAGAPHEAGQVHGQGGELPAPEPAGSSGIPGLAVALGGGAIVALGLGATMEAIGLSDRSRLEGTCKVDRSCDPSAVSTARTRVAVGDVALGAGALLLAGAVYVYLSRPAAQATSAVRLRIGPVAGGVVAGIEGAL